MCQFGYVGVECGLEAMVALPGKLVALRNRDTLIVSYVERAEDVEIEMVERGKAEIYTLEVEGEYAVPSFLYFSSSSVAPVTIPTFKHSPLLFLVHIEAFPATLVLTLPEGDR